jgi:very-short-patch-repair endonuclease
LDVLENAEALPMGSKESTEPTVLLEAVLVDIEADGTLGYASIQNAVPVIRFLRLTNNGPDALEGLEVLVSCNPRFAEGARLRFDRLAPSESRRISPIDLRPDHTYLADLQEAAQATITVVVMAGNTELARKTQAVEVLAYDQWAGTRALPELLAAFCMPNNPAIDVLIHKASGLLRSAHNELSMNGYQSKNRGVVWKQISAVYSTIAAAGLHYAEPPASFGTDGQKIRTPDRILDAGVATCLDLAMLFASCFEQAGLRPVVLVKEGHAWVGVWLHQASFPDPLTDDVQAVRKRVDSGELLVFETTGIALHHSHRPTLRIAMEQGSGHLLDEQSFRYAVDIHRAREVQIKPLPSRAAQVRQAEREEDESAAAIEPIPRLPDLDVGALTPLDLPFDDTPEGRLSKWKSRLLDLTLRNKLLNFKATKTTLKLVAPDLARLEDVLSDGKDFKVRPLPGIMEGADPRMAQVHAGRSGNSPLDDMALEALSNRDLLAEVKADELDGRLLAIHTAARTGLEEGGANTLYLAIGLLRWTEDEKSERRNLAPILLVPVTLQRQSVRSGFRLARHDDEAIVNPTLLQFLKANFELRIPGLEVVPNDEKGIDVGRVLQAFRLAVAEIKHWEVREEAHLGLFSFTKYLMWKDLQDRTEQLKANRVVKHLIDHPGQAFERDGEVGEFEQLDQSHKPQDILAPLLSDSSQLKAICCVDTGRDLVLEGPPGTGKSQTITNIIAHMLGRGKTVLFVSEKMAALSVVHRRLEAIGLGPFCLELHSSKSKKSEVLQQLGSALDMAGQRTADDWSREAERLTQLRQELNGLVGSLHQAYPNGLTVFDAIGTCIGKSGREPSSMPWADAMTHKRDELDKLRETSRSMATLAGSIGGLNGHPLGLIGMTHWSNTWGDDLLVACQDLARVTTVFHAKAQTLESLLGRSLAGSSMDTFGNMDTLADILLAAPKVPVAVARQAHEPATHARLQALVKHGTARAVHWESVGSGWTLQLAKLNGAELLSSWSQANASWWLKAILGKRAFTAKLAAFREDRQRPTAAQVDAMLHPLMELNEEDQVLRSMHADAQALLDDAYDGLKTDWSAVASHDDWAKRFSQAVARVAAGDDARAQALRSALQPMVAENRVALEPNGKVGQALLEFRGALRDMHQKLDALNNAAKPIAPIAGPANADGALERIQGVIAGWQSSKQRLQAWCLWRNVRDHAIAQGLQGLVSDLENGVIGLSEVDEHFEFSYRNWWAKKAIDVDPVLRNFASAEHERKIREFRAADANFQKLTERYLAATLAGRIPSAAGVAAKANPEMGRLLRERQKQRAHMPVRQLVQAMPTLLPKLKPCLLMSPLSVSQYLDAGFSQFDLVIFDEASQIPVWDAVGVIARGKQVVVVGDPKQLPPTNFFNKSSDSDEGGFGDDERVEDLESILDECLGAGMNKLSLKWHYRSRHESLITFSNHRYYDDSLVTFPSPVTDDLAVKFQRVAGVYDRGGSRTNRAEAQAIVAGIEEHFLDPKKRDLTLGVVTFNQTQQSLIDTLLDARRRDNSDLDRAIAAQTREKLFVKNLENVQGDERDVIFFSITYGPDAAGKTTMNFGPLNGEGGHRRLNVAISRAREAVVIYSTLMPEQIDLARVRAAGVRDLKHYLEFAIRGARALVEQSSPSGVEPESPFELAVIKVLRDMGWTVHPQVGCSGYRIDLAVVDPRAPGRYLVGIECDGRAYHSGATARDRDRLRQLVLEGLGWRIHRIWSTDWWVNPEGEVQKMAALLQSLVEKEAEDDDAGGAPDEYALERQEPLGTDRPGDSPEAGSGKELPEAIRAATQVSTGGSQEHGPQVYAPTTVEPGDPFAFYESHSNRRLADQLQRIVEAEGPIPESALLKRVARAWGLERTGAKIVERLRLLVPASLPRTEEGHETFYWPANAEPKTWSGLRIADGTEGSKRHVAEVSIEEVAALALHVVREAGWPSRADTARAVCRLIGMARMPADAERRVMEAVDALVAAKRLSDSGALRIYEADPFRSGIPFSGR